MTLVISSFHGTLWSLDGLRMCPCLRGCGLSRAWTDLVELLTPKRSLSPRY